MSETKESITRRTLREWEEFATYCEESNNNSLAQWSDAEIVRERARGAEQLARRQAIEARRVLTEYSNDGELNYLLVKIFEERLGLNLEDEAIDE